MQDFECIRLNDVDKVSVIKFKDEKVMDPGRIEQLGQELMSLAGEKNRRNLLINFENVKFFSSAAINKLIVLEKRMRARGGQMRLSNLRPEVRDLFSFTNLDALFDIRDEQDEAIKSFDKK
jgi:anti-anti-sigma factor